MRGARTIQPRRVARALCLAAVAVGSALTAAAPAAASLMGPIAAPPASLHQVGLTSARICATMQLTFYQDPPGPRYQLALFEGATQRTPRTTDLCSTATDLTPGQDYTFTLKGTLDTAPDAPLTTNFGSVTFTTAVDAAVQELSATSATVCLPPEQRSSSRLLRKVVFSDAPVELRKVLADSAGDCQTVTGLSPKTTYRLGLAAGRAGQPEAELTVSAEADFTTPSETPVAVSKVTASSAQICMTGLILAVLRRTVLFDGTRTIGESSGACVTATDLQPGRSYTLALATADEGAPNSALLPIGSVSFTTDQPLVTVTATGTTANVCVPAGLRAAPPGRWLAQYGAPAPLIDTTDACAVVAGLTPDRRYDLTITTSLGEPIGLATIRTAKDPDFVPVSVKDITTEGATLCAEGLRPSTETLYSVFELGIAGRGKLVEGPDPCQVVTGLKPSTTYALTFFHRTDDPGVPAVSERTVFVKTLDPPFVERTPTVDQITSTSVRICGGGPTRPPVIQRLVVFSGDTKLTESNGICQTVTGLTPATTYTLTIKSTLADTPDSTLVTEGSVTFDTLPRETFAYTVTGAATLKTLVKGSVALRGSLDATVTAATGAITANLALEKSTANLVALGFLPVSAQVALISTEPLTGTVVGGSLSVVGKLRIKIPQVSLFGVPIGGGSTCQAKQISSVALISTQTTFDPALGGPIAGTFSISDLTGCGALTGILSPLTAGKGNALLLNLAPKA